jgi:hypothetical protein
MSRRPLFIRGLPVFPLLVAAFLLPGCAHHGVIDQGLSGSEHPAAEPAKVKQSVKKPVSAAILVPEWSARFPGSPWWVRAYAVAVAPDGRIAVAGVAPNEKGLTGAMVRVLSPSGTLLWEERYKSPVGEEAQASGVGFLPDGGVVTGGGEWRRDIGQDSNWLIRAFDRDGRARWEWRRDGPRHGADAVSKLATDAQGYIYAGGVENNVCWRVRSFAPDGTLRWEAGPGEDGGDGGWIVSVAPDGEGGAVAGGHGSVAGWLLTGLDSRGQEKWRLKENWAQGYEKAATAASDDNYFAVVGHGIVPGGKDDWQVMVFHRLKRGLTRLTRGTANSDVPFAVAWLAPGKLVVGGYDDGTADSGHWRVALAERKGGKWRWTVAKDEDAPLGVVFGLALCPDGSMVAVGTDTNGWLVRKYRLKP